MPLLRIVPVAQVQEWESIIAQAFQYDFYHLPSYHALAEQRGEGESFLFAYADGEYMLALPILLRRIETVPGLEQVARGLRDATSVYGYAGPVASCPVIPQPVLEEFWRELRKALESLDVIAVFSRLHPLIPQSSWLQGLGEQIGLGETVSIDLTLSIDNQRALYRKGHRYDINRLCRLGAACVHDTHRVYLGDFSAMYRETMRRVGAVDYYLFEDSYFDDLVAALGDNLSLFVVLLEDMPICAGMFVLCKGIVQYHLSGMREEHSRIAPTKLLIDTVRLWAADQGARILHLGGGVGAHTDSLFEFKAGFSPNRHTFSVWKWVVEPTIYDQLCHEKARWDSNKGDTSYSTGYFPQYRSATNAR
jgi:CelD/BcsL family acetyltransferase involved in cellulose biosynthesis